MFRAAVDLVQGCRACDACWSKGKPCAFSDGFDKLSPLLEKADVIVFCSPIYWFDVTAQIKAAIDKLYPYLSEKRKTALKISESVLLLCAGEADSGIFKTTIENYKSTSGFLQWKDRGIIAVPGVYAKGDIAGNEALVQAEQLGASI